MVEIYTVREAIADLQELDPDLPMVLSSDDEGNNIRMVHSIGTQIVRELEYDDMQVICEEDIAEYDSLEDYLWDHNLPVTWRPVKVAEVW